ncbi:uncharacterized protein EV422DRAFT_537578 [Fimicolochytrium jonesii]|uniref:uncharacterized protein n=1 Tax=Fimicolochytrium jonesii TaxID=1396493 RepID=UPI0022FE50DD|nr:uncharacterized protein EV422DRAFT_537578 [Fimicolochytrium jonesii]KAI8818577.1 hypothetical protein EV422DRAFT_537578 [Fimicolochytrium jonesii]
MLLKSVLFVAACASHWVDPVVAAGNSTINLPGWENVQKAWAAVQKVDTGSDAWDRLAEMTDTYGPRKTGTPGYLKSLKWLRDQLQADDLKIFQQPVPNVPTWTRKDESLTLISNKERPNFDIPVLALGSSFPTSKKGITGAVIPITSLAQLNTTDVRGKIVLVNYNWTGYGAASRIRSTAAQTVEAFGAKAVIIRSATSVSQRTVHTGFSRRAGIPAAAISPEDANLLQRLYKRSQTNPKKYPAPVVQLNLQSDYRNTTTYNIFADLPGTTHPKDLVLIGGHFDSWDVGVGAGDDGGPVFAAWEAIRLIKKSGIKLKRTIRLTGWANEESGSHGAAKYAEYVQAENKKRNGERHILAIESDFGVATPAGLTVESYFPAGEKALKVLQAAAQADALIQANHWGTVEGGGEGYSGSDTELLGAVGVPVAGFETTITSDTYFAFHHSRADQMEVVNPRALYQNALAFAFWAIVASELDKPLGEIEV